MTDFQTYKSAATRNATGRYWVVPCAECQRGIYLPIEGWAGEPIRRACNKCKTPHTFAAIGTTQDLSGDTVMLTVGVLAKREPTPVVVVGPVAQPSAPKPPAFDTTSTLYVDVLEALTLCNQALVVGPPGSGKTTLGEALAANTARTWVFVGCSEGVSEAHITGRMAFDGRFLPSAFITAIESERPSLTQGDELDAMTPNTALVWQGFLANRLVSVPNRPANPLIRVAPHHWFLGSANTFGNGSADYGNSRNGLDPAFLDRFAGLTFEVGYDTQLEYAIAESMGTAAGAAKPRKPRAERDASAPGSGLAAAFWRVRANVERGRVKRPVSTRSLITLSKLYAARPAYYTLKRLLDRFMVGWSDTEKAKALEGIDLSASAEAEPAPMCPIEGCGSPLESTARSSAGGSWYACSRFPECRGFVMAGGI